MCWNEVLDDPSTRMDAWLDEIPLCNVKAAKFAS
jgi:hypothetical protein